MYYWLAAWIIQKHRPLISYFVIIVSTLEIEMLLAYYNYSYLLFQCKMYYKILNGYSVVEYPTINSGPRPRMGLYPPVLVLLSAVQILINKQYNSTCNITSPTWVYINESCHPLRPCVYPYILPRVHKEVLLDVYDPCVPAVAVPQYLGYHQHLPNLPHQRHHLTGEWAGARLPISHHL